MAYTAFSLAPPSLADHLTWGNLCRHAATEVVLCDQRIHNLMGLAAAAIATFTSNNTLRFICTTGFAVLAGLRAKNEIQKVKACAVQLHKDTSQIHQEREQIAGKISRTQQELNLLNPFVQAKNPQLKRFEGVHRDLREANEFLNKAAELNKCLDKINRSRMYVSLLTAASVFFPPSSNQVLRVGVHFGLMLTYLYPNFSLARTELRQVTHNLEMAHTYLKTASEKKNRLDREEKKIKEAAEDFLKRFDLNPRVYRLSSALQRVYREKTAIHTHQQKFSELRSKYQLLVQESQGFKENPIRSPANSDRIKNQYEDLRNSIKQFLQPNGENEKLYMWVRKIREVFDLETQARLECFNQIERRLSSHRDFPLTSSIFHRLKCRMTVSPYLTHMSWACGLWLETERVIGQMEEQINKYLTFLIPTKFMSSNQITGGSAV